VTEEPQEEEILAEVTEDSSESAEAATESTPEAAGA
jgi:hypothetical protein